MITYIKQLNRLRRMEKSTREKRDLRNISYCLCLAPYTCMIYRTAHNAKTKMQKFKKVFLMRCLDVNNINL